MQAVEIKVNLGSITTMTKKLVLVTGATSGIGSATAKVFAKNGFSLVMMARREDRLKEIQRECRALGVSCEYLLCDLQNKESILTALKNPLISQVDILINNAGLALGTESFAAVPLEDSESMIETNFLGLVRLTRGILPSMVAKQAGFIVNLGSVAGKWTYPGGAVYCATKAAVKSFSEGLRMDVAGTGIRVTNIEPGMVETEFSEVRFRSKDKAKSVYENMKPLTAEDIAETILWSVQRPAHVNIQEMVVFPTDQAGVGYVHRRK